MGYRNQPLNYTATLFLPHSIYKMSFKKITGEMVQRLKARIITKNVKQNRTSCTGDKAQNTSREQVAVIPLFVRDSCKN